MADEPNYIKPGKRKHLKFLFVFRHDYTMFDGGRSVYCLGMLDDENVYYYDEFWLKKSDTGLTPKIAKTMRIKFKNFDLDSNTCVGFSENIGPYDLFRVFFKIIHLFVDFEFTTVKNQQIFKSIDKYHRFNGYNKAGKYAAAESYQGVETQRVIDGMFRRSVVPWFAKELELSYENSSHIVQHRKAMVGSGVYYLMLRSCGLMRGFKKLMKREARVLEQAEKEQELEIEGDV